MKKLFLFLFIIISFNCFCQVSIIKSEVKYDDNFDPVITVTIKNETDKTITNVWMVFCFSTEKSGWSIPVAYEYIDKNVSVTINSKISKSFTVNLKSPQNGYKYSHSGMRKIRFSDGSILE